MEQQQQQTPHLSDKALVITAIKTLDHAVTTQRGAFEKALPAGFQLNQIIALAKSVIKTNVALAKCEMGSLVGAVMKATQYGLALGELGQAYIVPIWNSKLGCNEAHLWIGYRGFMELARRSGSVKKVSARVVYANDVFNVSYGAVESITHTPCLEEDRGAAKFVYAIATLENGEYIFEVLPISVCDKLKDSQTSKIKYNKDESPWIKHFDEMCRKTAIRRLFKYLPVEINKAPIISEMLALDNSEYSDAELEKIIDVEPIIPPQTEGEAKLDIAKDSEKSELIKKIIPLYTEKMATVDGLTIKNTILKSYNINMISEETLLTLSAVKLAEALNFLINFKGKPT